jgi:hypothetical protein
VAIAVTIKQTAMLSRDYTVYRGTVGAVQGESS